MLNWTWNEWQFPYRILNTAMLMSWICITVYGKHPILLPLPKRLCDICLRSVCLGFFLTAITLAGSQVGMLEPIPAAYRRMQGTPHPWIRRQLIAGPNLSLYGFGASIVFWMRPGTSNATSTPLQFFQQSGLESGNIWLFFSFPYWWSLIMSIVILSYCLLFFQDASNNQQEEAKQRYHKWLFHDLLIYWKLFLCNDYFCHMSFWSIVEWCYLCISFFIENRRWETPYWLKFLTSLLVQDVSV